MENTKFDSTEDGCERYYDIIAKDNDPEVARVLDRITDSAKTRFEYENLKSAFEPYADADFFVYETLCKLNAGQSVELIAGQFFAELTMTGMATEFDDIKLVVQEIKDKCGIEVFVLGIAGEMMFGQNHSPTHVLLSIEKLL